MTGPQEAETMKKLTPDQIAARARKTVDARHKGEKPKTKPTLTATQIVREDIGGEPVALPALPKLPRAPRKPRPGQICACGCGQTTKGGRFVPGHDGRLHGWVVRVERGLVAISSLEPGVRAAVEAAMTAKEAK